MDSISHQSINVFPSQAARPNHELAEKMLENFLSRKEKKVGNLPERKVWPLTGSLPEVPGVYVIRDGAYYKIGHTTNFRKRIYALRLSNPRELSLEYFIEATNRLQAKRLEGALHSFFALKCIRGEWYALDETDVKFLQDYQASTGQAVLRAFDLQNFGDLKKDTIMDAMKRACKALGKRTMTIQEAMKENQELGLTFAGWKDALDHLDREKRLYFSGNLIRVPVDAL